MVPLSRALSLVATAVMLMSADSAMAQPKPSALETFRRAMERCWVNAPSAVRERADLAVAIDLRLGSDGSILQVSPTDSFRLSEPVYRTAAESAVRAVRSCRVHLDAPRDSFEDEVAITVLLRPAQPADDQSTSFECPDDLLRRSVAMNGRPVRLDAYLECSADRPAGSACRAYCEPYGLRLPVGIAGLDQQSQDLLTTGCMGQASQSCRASIVGTFRKLPRSALIEAASVLPPLIAAPSAAARSTRSETSPVPVFAPTSRTLRTLPNDAPDLRRYADAPAQANDGDLVTCAEKAWILPRPRSECTAAGGRVLE